MYRTKKRQKMVGQNICSIIFWKTLTKRFGYKAVFENQVNPKNMEEIAK
jgi:hypothetical protein